MFVTFLSLAWLGINVSDAVAGQAEITERDGPREKPWRLEQRTHDHDFPRGTEFLSEDFSGNELPAGWTTEELGDPGLGWEFGSELAFIDSDAAGSGIDVAGTLTTPALNLSTASHVRVALNHFYRHIGNSFGQILISTDGNSWEVAYEFTATVGSSSYPLFEYDITDWAAGESEVYIQFLYDDGGSWAWWWEIDNVLVYEFTPPEPIGDLLFSQALDTDGSGHNSTFDTSEGIDYEVADNFFGLDNDKGDDINAIEFYGIWAEWDEGFSPSEPEETEPFWIRFYEYVEDFVPGLEAPETGTYELELRDAADHWNWGGGSFVTVYVEGVAVIEDAIMLSGDPNPKYYTFSANQGDEITTIYTPGSWAAENYYAIIDPNNNVIAEEGGTAANPGESVPGNIESGQVMALEPDWANPVHEEYIIADAEYSGSNVDWNPDFMIYKFTVELPEGLSMSEGWFSPQLDSDATDGWFLFWTSLEGDGLAYQRDGAPKSFVRGEQHPSVIRGNPDKQLTRDPIDDDLAFSLFNIDDVEEPAPIPLSSWALYLGILLMVSFVVIRFRRII